MNNLAGKKIGIWGFGIVGQSLIKFLSNQNFILSVLDKRQLNTDEILFLNKNNISFCKQSNDADIENFFNNHDIIIPSPGIDLRKYKQYFKKIITELDIFSLNFKKKVIAVTGTVGKTTVTHLLAEILKNSGINAMAAGNIGLGMCDLIEIQDKIDIVILEVSSFQLEYCKFFAPDVAIWTNYYENHLDRHGSMQAYFDAKFNIFINQKNNNMILAPFEIAQKIYDKNVSGKLNFFTTKPKSDINFSSIKSADTLFFIDNNYIVKQQSNKLEKIINLNYLPDITFVENFLIIFSALYLEKIDFNNSGLCKLSLPEHRLERFAIFHDIEFYNDSKSTIPDATIAAVNKLQNKSIILFLGGVSKGVDRAHLIEFLKNKVKFIICFGAEAQNLKFLCENNNIKSVACNTLPEAVLFCFEIMQKNDFILFSPAGASFDLFANYQERGKTFKNLVNIKINKKFL